MEILESIVGSLVSLAVVILVVGGIVYFIADRVGLGQKLERLRVILHLTGTGFAYFLFALWIISGIILLIAVFFLGYTGP